MNSCGKEQQPTLKLLMWEGYADPEVIGPFEEAHHCRVAVSYMKNSDDLLAQLRKDTYDVISPSSDVAGIIARNGLAEPLKLSQIPNYTALSQRLTQLDLVKIKGKPLLPIILANDSVYGVPFMWGPNVLLYNPNVVSEPPTSWGFLWDPKYRDEIAVWDDLSTLYVAAQTLGYDRPNPDAIYKLNDGQLQSVRKKLLELKQNGCTKWSTTTELATLFERGKTAVAMGWPLVAQQLTRAHFPIAQVIPEENTTGWIDHLMIPSRSRERELAYEFINYMLQEDIQKRVGRTTGYVPANERAALSVDRQDAIQTNWQHINFWQPIPDRRQYIDLWNEIGIPEPSSH